MPSVVEQAWVGRRVVLRRRSTAVAGSAPRYSDSLGDLLRLDDATAVVETGAGLVDIPVEEVAVARLVLPAAGEQLALEAVCARGWVAEHSETTSDGWLLRADAGWTGRANSALPLRTLQRPLTDALAEVTAWYRERGLRPMIQLPLPVRARLDEALAQRRWTFPEQVHVMVARLDLLLAALPPAATPAPAAPVPPIDLLPAPDPAWLGSYHYRGGTLPAAAVALLTRHDRVAFARCGAAADGRSAAAIARGVVDDGWLGVTAVEVAPDQRRRGLARALLVALAEWARTQGATRCYLQVSAGNEPALALYRGLGFYEHHSYHYRTPPTI